jgi:hypothetical protein
MIDVLRKLLILVSVMSGAMCVVTVVLWVRSAMVHDWLYYETSRFDPDGFWVQVYSFSGTLKIEVVLDLGSVVERRARGVQPGPSKWEFSSRSIERRLEEMNWVDFHVKWRRLPEEDRFDLKLPYCFLAAVTGALPAYLALKAIRRRREQRQGLCRLCGYDLSATPQRCPECGAAPVPSPGTPGEG